MLGLQGRVAFVTGAAGGIGRAICERFLEEGIDVAAADIDEAALNNMVTELGGNAAKLVPIVLDITNFEAAEAAVKRVIDEFGRIDILVNNAGWDVAKPFVETSADFWDKVISINLRGPLNLHRAVLPYMIEAGGGRVINVASDAGRVGSSGESVYSACKGGLISFTKSVARECASKNIRLNAVCPGPTDTPLLRSFVGEGEYGQKLYEKLKRSIPLKRLGQPKDLPGIIAFLSSDDADFITGQVISVSGGLTMHG
ncbi:MAG: 2-hydroxycyclohexanecarboxyl-CoA dehydrogenase [Bradyrhizobium sp.]|nr:2-hydroxycyclohexanecarboxyl-CoA dehydrogenase [Bradyrhizobium sp.]